MADVSRLPGPVADLWDWQLAGACRTADPSMFFHPEGERGSDRARRQEAARVSAPAARS
jgi:WhiB family redox-sensing transcriptional regulator